MKCSSFFHFKLSYSIHGEISLVGSINKQPNHWGSRSLRYLFPQLAVDFWCCAQRSPLIFQCVTPCTICFQELRIKAADCGWFMKLFMGNHIANPLENQTHHFNGPMLYRRVFSKISKQYRASWWRTWINQQYCCCLPLLSERVTNSKWCWQQS